MYYRVSRLTTKSVPSIPIFGSKNLDGVFHSENTGLYIQEYKNVRKQKLRPGTHVAHFMLHFYPHRIFIIIYHFHSANIN